MGWAPPRQNEGAITQFLRKSASIPTSTSTSHERLWKEVAQGSARQRPRERSPKLFVALAERVVPKSSSSSRRPALHAESTEGDFGPREILVLSSLIFSLCGTVRPASLLQSPCTGRRRG